MIMASCVSDDLKIRLQFDATEWFEQATDEQIIDLMDAGWGGSEAADVVADFFRSTDTSALFAYLESHPLAKTNDAIGFEVHVNEEAAIDWVVENRDHVIPLTRSHMAMFPGL